MITVDAPLVAPPRGTVEQALAYARQCQAERLPEVEALIRAVFAVAPTLGLDPAVIVAHSAVETGNPHTGCGWRSPAWRDRLNPAGIGITDGGDFGYRWASGEHAAYALLVHYAAYVYGTRAPERTQQLYALHRDDDPRFQAVFDAGWAGTVHTLGDLEGKWFTNPRGAEAIVARFAEIFGDGRGGSTVSEVTFGRVPRPAWVDQYIEKPAGHGYGDYGPRRFRGIVLHRMVGTLTGTRSHFRATSGHGLDALTDWGIGGALDGALDGTIDRYNDPDGRRSPWASGPAIDSHGRLLVNGDAVDWYRRYALSDPAGLNIFNRDTEAIELSGMYDTPVSDKQYRSLVALIAWRLDAKMRLPWHVWPKNHDGVQAILWHGEIMGWQKACPGRVVTEMTTRLINDVRDYLRRYQEGAPAPAPSPARPEDDPEVLKSWFGRLRAKGRVLTYSPEAAKNPSSISAIWRRHGEATGEYPRIAEYTELPDGTRVYEFDGGWKVIDPAGPAKPRPAGKGA